MTTRTAALVSATVARLAERQVTPNVAVHTPVPAALVPRVLKKTIWRVALRAIFSVPVYFAPDFLSATERVLAVAVAPRNSRSVTGAPAGASTLPPTARVATPLVSVNLGLA